MSDKYRGPVRIRFTGDQSVGQNYINEGRKYLGQLERDMELNELQQLYHEHALADGTRIRVERVFNGYTMEIDTRRTGGLMVVETEARIPESDALISSDDSDAPICWYHTSIAPFYLFSEMWGISTKEENNLKGIGAYTIATRVDPLNGGILSDRQHIMPFEFTWLGKVRPYFYLTAGMIYFDVNGYNLHEVNLHINNDPDEGGGVIINWAGGAGGEGHVFTSDWPTSGQADGIAYHFQWTTGNVYTQFTCLQAGYAKISGLWRKFMLMTHDDQAPPKQSIYDPNDQWSQRNQWEVVILDYAYDADGTKLCPQAIGFFYKNMEWGLAEPFHGGSYSGPTCPVFVGMLKNFVPLAYWHNPSGELGMNLRNRSFWMVLDENGYPSNKSGGLTWGPGAVSGNPWLEAFVSIEIADIDMLLEHRFENLTADINQSTDLSDTLSY